MGEATDAVTVRPSPRTVEMPSAAPSCTIVGRSEVTAVVRDVLRALDRLRALGRPLLLAVSRKYFVGAITGRPPAERLAGTIAASLWAARAGAAILRVHDVAAVRDALAVDAVLEGRAEVPAFDADDEQLKWIRTDR